MKYCTREYRLVICILLLGFCLASMPGTTNTLQSKTLQSKTLQSKTLQNKTLKQDSGLRGSESGPDVQEITYSDPLWELHGLTKRGAESARVGTTWYEYHAAQQGIWWTNWEPASCVHGNGFKKEPLPVSLNRAVSHRAKYGLGFSLEFGIASTTQYGYETGKASIILEPASYVVPANGYGQVWSQQMMVWQDQQHRVCTKHFYGPNGITCGPWSGYIRGDLPVLYNVRFIWSTGWKILDFDTCGGGS